MSFESDIQKDLKILQQEKQNTVDKNNINPEKILKTPENFRKQLTTIRLIVGYDFQHGTFDASANDGKGGYINKIVTIVQGGPDQIVPPSHSF